MICASTLLMNFYLGSFYSNDIITRFTDPSELLEVRRYVQCSLNQGCDSKSFVLLEMILNRSATCGMTGEQMASAAVPLQAVKYRLMPSHTIGLKLYGFHDVAHGDFLAFNDEFKNDWRGMPKGTILLRSLTQRVAFYTRIFEHSIIPRRLIYANFSKAASLALKALVMIGEKNFEGYLESFFRSDKYLRPNEPRGLFTLPSFVQLIPLFLTVIVVSCILFAVENAVRSAENSIQIGSRFWHRLVIGENYVLSLISAAWNCISSVCFSIQEMRASTFRLKMNLVPRRQVSVAISRTYNGSFSMK